MLDLNVLTFVKFADVSLATAALLLMVWLRSTNRIRASHWRMYWAGVAIGMTWELSYYLQGPRFSADPPYQLNIEFPFHPHTQPLFHSLWDGSLFMFGVWLVTKFCSPPHLARFRWTELLVLVGWGQLQELCVELIATTTGAWTFLPSRMNPVLFEHGIGHITLVPQLIWFAAPIAFYAVALIIERRSV